MDIGSFEEYRIEVLLFVVAHSGVKAHFRKRVAGLAPFVIQPALRVPYL